MKTTHTLTAWKVKQYKLTGQWVIYKNNGEPLECPLKQETAEFITKRVNNHDALVEALEEVLAYDKDAILPSTLEKINEALKQAEN